METWFSITFPGAGASQRKQALDIVRTNINWVETREIDIIGNLVTPSRLKNKK
jgi:hypothetical protein